MWGAGSEGRRPKKAQGETNPQGKCTPPDLVSGPPRAPSVVASGPSLGPLFPLHPSETPLWSYSQEATGRGAENREVRLAG